MMVADRARTVVLDDEVDVVVVGARPSGCATAIAFARRGIPVVALDKAKFPSDTLSTHFLWSTGIAELKWLGALGRVRAVGAPEYRMVHPNIVEVPDGERLDPHATMSVVDGLDYGLCTRRPGLDMALVETAREAGVEVREQCTVTEVVWERGRVCRVRYRSADGDLHEIRAKLVVGADGRRSGMAKMLGVERPYRSSPAGRGLVFIYVTDNRPPQERKSVYRWQSGETLGFFFPWRRARRYHDPLVVRSATQSPTLASAHP